MSLISKFGVFFALAGILSLLFALFPDRSYVPAYPPVTSPAKASPSAQMPHAVGD